MSDDKHTSDEDVEKEVLDSVISPEQPSSTVSNYVLWFNIVLNVISTVGVILTNKFLYDRMAFEYMVTLSCMHYVFTGVAIRVMMRFGFFDYKPASGTLLLPVTLGSLGSIMFNNLSLAHNTVGFAQVARLMTIPFTLVYSYLLKGDTVSYPVLLSLSVILFGVGVAMVTEVSLNGLGFTFALLGVVTTVVAQVYTQIRMKEIGLDAMQLLLHVTPVVSVGMAMSAPLFDNLFNGPDALVEYPFNVTTWTMIFLSCGCALGVNVSNYCVVGKAGPITYQVVGHLKSCLILTLGFIIFGVPSNWRNIAGILFAVVGMIMYSEFKRRGM